MPSGETRLTEEVVFELGLRSKKVLVDSLEHIPGQVRKGPELGLTELCESKAVSDLALYPRAWQWPDLVNM